MGNQQMKIAFQKTAMIQNHQIKAILIQNTWIHSRQLKIVHKQNVYIIKAWGKEKHFKLHGGEKLDLSSMQA